jgi:hypothetical protein
MNLVDPTIPLRDLLRLLIQLGEDESELLLNLHGDLKARTVLVHQDLG